MSQRCMMLFIQEIGMRQEPYNFYLLYFAAYLLNLTLIFQIISKRIENFLLISKELAYNPKRTHKTRRQWLHL